MHRGDVRSRLGLACAFEFIKLFMQQPDLLRLNAHIGRQLLLKLSQFLGMQLLKSRQLLFQPSHLGVEVHPYLLSVSRLWVSLNISGSVTRTLPESERPLDVAARPPPLHR